MKFFFNKKRQGNFNLTVSDFTTETTNAVVKIVSISPELLKLLPKRPDNDGKEIPTEVKSSKTTIQLFQTSVEVCFDPSEVKEELEQFIQKINERLNWLASYKKLVDEILIKKILSLKNSTWLEEDEMPLTKDIFLSRIKLITIIFFDDLSFELYFDDGDIFAGHIIEVSVSMNKKVQSATIAG